MDAVKIRAARSEDAKTLLEIYSYYVENSALTFEYITPTLKEFEDRIKTTLQTYPYLVAESEGEILGYAYAGRFHPRAAYAWNSEMTIYLKKSVIKQGVGRQLYTLLENILKEQGVVKTIALITYPSDEYTNFGSMQFHEKMGYNHAGKMENCGYKFDRWYTTLCMDKIIGVPQNNMKQIKTFDQVRNKFEL